MFVRLAKGWPGAAHDTGTGFRAGACEVIAAALLAALLLLIPAGRGAVAADTISVVDDEGRSVTLARPARRVVTLAPHATELVFEVGAGDHLVAVSEASDYPAAARHLPQIGGASGLDLERVAQLHPDLILAWTSGNSRAQIEALERAGLPVFESDPKNIEQIATSLIRVGLLTGHAELGRARAEQLRSGFAALRTRFADSTRLTVFYPLSEHPIYTVGAPHLTSQLMQICGARNIFSDVNALAPEVSAEAVVARHPDLIITDPGEVDATRRVWLARGALAGSADNNVVGINPDLLTRGTSRALEGTVALCTALERLREGVP